jgi:four helix bundle protein
MRDFQSLRVWQQAHGLCQAVYLSTASFPPDERFGLTSQMRRSVISISANIAEGAGRSTNPDFSRFLSVAAGSCSELQALVLVGRDLDLLDPDAAARMVFACQAIRRQIFRLIEVLMPDT